MKRYWRLARALWIMGRWTINNYERLEAGETIKTQACGLDLAIRKHKDLGPSASDF